MLRGLGPLGKRLFAAFLAVAIVAIGTLSAASFISTRQGLNAQALSTRQATVDALVVRIENAYSAQQGGTLQNIDYTAVNAAADAAGVRYVVRDAGGDAVASYRIANGMGAGMMGMMGTSTSDRWLDGDITIAGTSIGTVFVWFPTALASVNGESIAFAWIAIAAMVALLAAFLLAWLVSRGIARPLLRISSAARRFADGDRTARTDPKDARAGWELGELARAFDATADNVVRSETARRHIAADVAHELRTPLTVLQAGLEEVRDGLVPADPDHIAVLHAQAVRLGRIVEDLASLAAAETAALSLHLDTVDLAEVASTAMRDVEPLLSATGIHTSVAVESASVHGDADRLHQAATNLLTNCARYCRPGDVVELRVSKDDGLARLSVQDSGPGIPEADIPHVFDRLWRGTHTGDGQGSGIGLAVVRELVRAHNGKVDARRNAEGGMTFTISLPLLGTPSH